MRTVTVLDEVKTGDHIRGISGGCYVKTTLGQCRAEGWPMFYVVGPAKPGDRVGAHEYPMEKKMTASIGGRRKFNRGDVVEVNGERFTVWEDGGKQLAVHYSDGIWLRVIDAAEAKLVEPEPERAKPGVLYNWIGGDGQTGVGLSDGRIFDTAFTQVVDFHAFSWKERT